MLPTSTEARTALARLKADLIARGEATDLFARERDDAFAALLGNPGPDRVRRAGLPKRGGQGGAPALLRHQNHPFSDGNKRSGAFPVRRLPQPQRPPAG